MRIIAGEFRRRLLKSPPDGEITRPIPDRVKESLFGLLRGHCEGANVFDGFAGTGAIGLEAVSRGAKHCVMVEQHPAIAKLLQQNVRTLGVEDRCEVVTGDALGPGALARAPRPLTLAFLDPPYPLVREELGFKRVMAQMAKLVELLTDDASRCSACPRRSSTDPRAARPSPRPRSSCARRRRIATAASGRPGVTSAMSFSPSAKSGAPPSPSTSSASRNSMRRTSPRPRNLGSKPPTPRPSKGRTGPPTSAPT